MANKNFIVKNGLDVGGNVSANSRYTFDYNDHYLEAGTNSVSIKNGSGTSYLLVNNTGVTIPGNLTVEGTSTTLNVATLDVEDKNIKLNKGSGDTSGSADGAGITIQDAVDASTDATLLWNASTDNFEFSHSLRMDNAQHILFERGGELRSLDTGGSTRTIARIDGSNNLQYGYSGSGLVQFMGGGSYSERMRIHTNGNIAINHDSGPHTLTVKGTISRVNSSGIQVINLQTNSDAGQIAINNSGGTQRIRLDSNGSSWFTGGSVGIGTSSPQDTLHVITDSSTTNDTVDVARIEATSSGTPAVGFGPTIDFRGERGSASSDSMGRIGYVADVMTASRVDGAFVVETAIDGNYSERLRITSVGNVGINDTNPDRKVSIIGDSTSNGQYPLSLDATNTDYTLEFRRNGQSEWWIKQAGSSFNIHENGVGDQFRIAAGGKVGMGNTAPNGLLHIGDSSAEGSQSAPALQIGSTTNYRLGMYTDSETGYIENKNGDDGIIFKVKTAGQAMRICGGDGDVYIGGNTDRGRKLVVEGTGDLMTLYSTNSGAGGAQLDLVHDSPSYADGDSIGIVNFSTDDRQLGSIKTVATNSDRGRFHIGVRKDSSTYNHNAFQLENNGVETYLDIYSVSGSSRGAGYFRFKTDGSSTEESVAQIYMEQGSGDGASRKCNMYFQVADNGSPSTAMQIENNKIVSTISKLNVNTTSTATNGTLNVSGGIRFTAAPISHGLNVVSMQSFNNSSQNSCGSLYYKMFAINFYHNNGSSQIFGVSNGGGGVGYNFTCIFPGSTSLVTGTGIDQSFTTIGSSPMTFRIRITSGGGAFSVERTSGSGTYYVSVHHLGGQ